MPTHLRRRLAALLLCGALPFALCSCAEQSVSQELGDSSNWSSLESVGNSSKLDSSSNSSFLDDFGNSSELEKIDNQSFLESSGDSSSVEENSNRQDDQSTPPVASFQTSLAQEETARPAESDGTYTVLTPSASGTVVYSTLPTPARAISWCGMTGTCPRFGYSLPGMAAVPTPTDCAAAVFTMCSLCPREAAAIQSMYLKMFTTISMPW